MNTIKLTQTEIEFIDKVLNQGNAGVMEYTELIIENYFLGVRFSDADFPKQKENILKVLSKETKGQLFDDGKKFDRYSVPTIEKFEAFAKEVIWKWFNLHTERFEEFMEEHPEYKEWEEYLQTFYEFSGHLNNFFLETLGYELTFLGETTPNTKEALDELFEITDFTKKPNK